MKFKRRQVDDVQFNLTPMIDCLLFILVFLLLSTSFYQYSQLQLSLPEAQGQKAAVDEDQIELMVTQAGHYVLNGQPVMGQHPHDLRRAIVHLAGDRRDFRFIIAADAQASHQDVIRVMDVAGQLGFVHLHIRTKVPARGHS